MLYHGWGRNIPWRAVPWGAVNVEIIQPGWFDRSRERFLIMGARFAEDNKSKSELLLVVTWLLGVNLKCCLKIKLIQICILQRARPCETVILGLIQQIALLIQHKCAL